MNQAKAREKAAAMIPQMTIEEKVSQLLYQAKGVEKVGLHPYNWWNEALHGVARSGSATVFPQAIGLAASFHPALLREVGNAIAAEGRLRNSLFRQEEDYEIYKGLTYWSPNINIVRDPRWGRGHETYGEDPYLTSRMGTEFVLGVQGEEPEEGLKAACCAKHFAAHNGPESIRHGFSAKVTSKDLFETYLPAFEKLVKEARVAGVMSAYNAIEIEDDAKGPVPASCNEWLLRELLRKEWGFEGYTVSDCGAIHDIYERHHYAHSLPEAASLALKGGCNLNCGGVYEYLRQALEEGLIEEKDLDEALLHTLTVRFMLDMEEAPKASPKELLEAWHDEKSLNEMLALQAARESVVLLKNNGVLPLADPESIAVVGPNARSTEVLEGNYNGTADFYITPWDGVGMKFPDARIYVSEGSHLYKDKIEGSALPGDRQSEAVIFAKNAEVTLLCLGLSPRIEGEKGDATNEYSDGDKHNLYLPDAQREMALTVAKAAKEAGGKVICVLLSGGALDISDLEPYTDAVLQMFYPGEKGGLALAEVLCGEVNPTGRLPVTFYYDHQVRWDFSDYSMQGKTYRYFEEKPLYPFGFGLSYEYLTINKAEKREEGLWVEIENKLDHEVAMPIQVYASFGDEGVGTPKHQLVYADKITLGPGKVHQALLPIDPYWLCVVEEDGTRRSASCPVTFYVGDHQPGERGRELSGRSVIVVR